MNIWETTLRTFVDDVASSSPTPGGGSVSLVSAVLGSGLVAMAINVSLQGKAGVTHGGDLATALGVIEDLRSKLIEAANHDIDVFGKFMDAYRLPKGSASQKAARDSALSSAASVACNAPLSAAQMITRCLQVADEVRPLVSKMIVSDVDAGVYILRAAGMAALLNVDANLAWLSADVRETVIARTAEVKQALHETGDLRKG